MKTKLFIPNSYCFLFSFLLFIIAFPALAQTSAYVIKGKVIDKNTRAPLQGASVFAQNTTLGAATNEAGDFSIRLPEGGYLLAVTFTGYETESIRINRASSQEGDITFELSPLTKSLEEVSIVISNEVKDGWQKYGEFFIENFIGQTKFAKQCVIKNPEVLHFYFSKKRNRLKVVTEEPLVVDNFALGYTIKFAIDSFINEYNTRTNLFVGYPLFEKMTGTSEQEETWADNRFNAYNGSMLHFMRSLYGRTLQEDGFELQFIVKNNDDEIPIPIPDITPLNPPLGAGVGHASAGAPHRELADQPAMVAALRERARHFAQRAIDALSIFPDGAARRAMAQAAEFAVARGY